MDKIRVSIVKEFESKGLKFFRETMWSSSLQRADLPRIRTFLLKNDFGDIDVALAIPQDDNASRMKWPRHSERSGQCVSVMTPVLVPKRSNHLMLTFGYPDVELRSQNRPRTLTAVNALRLAFGLQVARELILTNFFGLEEELVAQTDGGYAAFDIQSIALFDYPAIDGAQLNRISEEAAFFLDKTYTQTDPAERFVLMWLAFEIIIHALIDEGSNEQKREAFFKNMLRSELANEEVLRLFRLRGEIFTVGRALNSHIEDDCRSLYTALQLAMMKDCDQRRAFLSGYEMRILRTAYAQTR